MTTVPEGTPVTFMKTVTVPLLQNCARCEGEHDHIEFKQFSNMPLPHTHWALCPANGEPILMQAVNVE